MSRALRDVLVVGGGAAGLITAEALRDAGFDGPIRLIGAERHLPYDRPPLSKQVLHGTTEPVALALRPADTYADLGLDLHLGRAATRLDLPARRLLLDDGGQLAFDGLVIATGVRARPLACVAPEVDVAYLRTLDDALRLRERLGVAQRVVVVGAGFLGVEVASAARRLGADVTVVEPQPVPMLRQFGPVVGELVRTLHEEEGTRFRLGVGVRDVVTSGAGTARVELEDSTSLEADVVVAAVGSVPDTDWLVGSGVAVRDGVVVDAGCRAADRVYAAGDVASWTDPATGLAHRFEHRMNASEQAQCVAANLLGGDRALIPSQYFWSDQAGVRIQAVGAFPAEGRLDVVAGSVASRSFVATVTHAGVVSGVLGWRSPRDFGRWRRSVGSTDAIRATA